MPANSSLNDNALNPAAAAWLGAAIVYQKPIAAVHAALLAVNVAVKAALLATSKYSIQSDVNACPTHDPPVPAETDAPLLWQNAAANPLKAGIVGVAPELGAALDPFAIAYVP